MRKIIIGLFVSILLATGLTFATTTAAQAYQTITTQGCAATIYPYKDERWGNGPGVQMCSSVTWKRQDDGVGVRVFSTSFWASGAVQWSPPNSIYTLYLDKIKNIHYKLIRGNGATMDEAINGVSTTTGVRTYDRGPYGTTMKWSGNSGRVEYSYTLDMQISGPLGFNDYDGAVGMNFGY